MGASSRSQPSRAGDRDHAGSAFERVWGLLRWAPGSGERKLYVAFATGLGSDRGDLKLRLFLLLMTGRDLELRVDLRRELCLRGRRGKRGCLDLGSW